MHFPTDTLRKDQKMSDIIKTYAQVVADTVAQIAGETEAVDKAAQLVADAIKRDELVHVIGPGGHSNMAVEEVLWRAGGLAPVDAILDAGTNAAPATGYEYSTHMALTSPAR